MAGGSSRPLDRVPPPDSAGSPGGFGAGFGLARPLDRWRGPAVGHPLAGQAGPPPLAPPFPPFPPDRPELAGRGAGRLTGGADPPVRLLTGAADAGGADPACGRGAVPAERPAPRDQPEAGAAGEPFDPFGWWAPCRGGRSSGGATRPLPPSASVTFLARAEPAPEAPPTTRREPPLASSSPSAGGGASGRSRDAYASPVPAAAGSAADPAASAAAPRPAAVPAATPADAPAATPADAPAATPADAPTATAAACPGFRRAH